MIEEIAWELLPRELPNEIEPWLVAAARQARLSERQFRALAWANRLLAVARFPGFVVSTAVAGSFEGNFEIADITAGFIPIFRSRDGEPRTKREQYLRYIEADNRPWIASVETENRVWVFGLLIGVQPSTERKQPFADETAIEKNEISQLIWPDGFPVICELRIDLGSGDQDSSLHAPTHPGGAATSACFVKPSQGKRFYNGAWTEGVLIARHVLPPGTTSGAQVSMVSGPALSVIDLDAGATTIDAAILDAQTGSIPANASQMPLHPAVAPGLSVTVHGSRSQFNADVLRVMDDPRYFGNMFAHRAVLDKYGVHGDSGAIVRAALTREAVGIYIGRLPGPPAEGAVQLMRQVSQYFEIELYDG